MNLAFLIIGVPAVGVAAFYAGILWGGWMAALVAVGLSLVLATMAVVDRRRRQAGRASPPSRG